MEVESYYGCRYGRVVVAASSKAVSGEKWKVVKDEGRAYSA